MPTPKITKKLLRRTRRLIVRPLVPGDYAAWARAQRACVPPRNRFDKPPLTEKLLTRRKFRERLAFQRRARAADLIYPFGVFSRKTGEFLGAVDLMIMLRLHIQMANLGYHILNPHWGNGYAREAARAALDLAFRELRLHRVEAGTEAGNRASMAVARGIGMRPEGVRRAFLYMGPKKGWTALHVFAITAEEWGRPGAPPRVRARMKEFL